MERRANSVVKKTGAQLGVQGKPAAKLEESKTKKQQPLIPPAQRATQSKFNAVKNGKENVQEEEQKKKTGFTEKPSDRFKKVKAADPFTSTKKHKTNFGYVYSSGGIPVRINHGGVKNSIQWDKQPEGKYR